MEGGRWKGKPLPYSGIMQALDNNFNNNKIGVETHKLGNLLKEATIRSFQPLIIISGYPENDSFTKNRIFIVQSNFSRHFQIRFIFAVRCHSSRLFYVEYSNGEFKIRMEWISYSKTWNGFYCIKRANFRISPQKYYILCLSDFRFL